MSLDGNYDSDESTHSPEAGSALRVGRECGFATTWTGGGGSGSRQQVHTVLFVAKCHLDVGFTLTQAKVMRKYFDEYFPAAMKTAAQMRLAGKDRYTWTTGSWLLYEYLEQADAGQRRRVEQAIADRDLAWHALPFSWQTEMVDRSMIEGALGFSRSLDQRFGGKTTGAKMTDVPGHSRGLVAPLDEAGVRLLDIGVNAASTPPQVPDLFLWKEPSGHSLAVLYHRHDYGSVLEIPGAGVAVDVEVRNDNSGPHTPDEIAAIYARLRARFPGAEIKAATMNDVAAAVDTVRSSLPVVTSEIGDTWIYGCASDPYKVARYRSAARMRREWVAKGRFAAGDATDRELLRRLLLAAEHTWGTDTKSYLDDEHYRPTSLAAVLDRPGYVTMVTSWKEKRDDIDEGIARLPADLQRLAQAGFAELQAVAPDVSAMRPHDPAKPIETRHFVVRLDPATGAIIGLDSKASGAAWAGPRSPLGLFTYQTLSSEQYAAFLKRYLTIETDWGPKDFGKPGIENLGAEAREWHPHVVRCLSSTSESEDRLVLELAIADPAAEQKGNVAWPRQIFVEMLFPKDTARIDLRVVTLGKIQNRMPEAMWLTFSPRGVLPKSWELEKVNQPVSAFDVVPGGGRAMHAVSDAVRCRTARNQHFEVRTLDAAVVAFGERSPLNFSLQTPDLAAGAHVSLFNNGWGTNYPQWSGGDWSYRFQLFG